MLRTFAHPVACCCVLLAVLGQRWKPVKLQATYKQGFSSSRRGHVSLCGRWICTTLAPEVRSRNTYDEISRAFGLIKLPRRKLEKEIKKGEKKNLWHPG